MKMILSRFLTTAIGVYPIAELIIWYDKFIFH